MEISLSVCDFGIEGVCYYSEGSERSSEFILHVETFSSSRDNLFKAGDTTTDGSQGVSGYSTWIPSIEHLLPRNVAMIREGVEPGCRDRVRTALIYTRREVDTYDKALFDH